MILSTLVMTGAATAGTLGAGVKVYRESKRKKQYPWTVAAEKMAKNNLSGLAGKPNRLLALPQSQSAFVAQGGVIKQVTFSVKKVQAQSAAFTQQLIAPFVDNSRNEQLEEIRGTEASYPSEAKMQKKAVRNFWLSSANLLLISGGALFYTPLYVPGVLGIAYLYSSFVKGAFHTLVHERRVNGEVLSTVTIGSAMVSGFFFATALRSWYAAIMRGLIAKTKSQSRQSLVNLLGEVPRVVWVVVDGSEVEIPFEDLQIGDQLVIMAGQMIPVDGTINAGMASIDQHMLTGEAQPAEKSIGEPVLASTVVLSGKITVQVEKTGSETVAAQIGEILNNTADFNLSIKSRVESFLEKVIPGWLLFSVATFPLLGLNGALAVLWFCPGYRMLILGPLSMLNYLHLLSRQGLLIKDGRSLEQLSEIDTIVFDKTGTLTQEMPHVSQIFSCNAFSQEEVLTYAAAAEYRQTHPIAKAILQAADMRQLHVPQIDDTHYEIGYGVKVNLNERVIRVGSQRFMETCGITIPAEIKNEQARCNTEGYSLVYVAIDEQLGGAIELVPTIRAEVKDVIRSLRESGRTLYIISGDHEAPTRRLAQELGIDHYFANTLPENKADLVKQLQEEGRTVCFIGDGINDAIALKQAHVSISLRGATTIAMDTAQIVLMDGNLAQLPHIFNLSQEFNKDVKSSFIMTLVPTGIGMVGAFFFNWGLLSAVLFKSFFWFPQLAHVMLPLYKHKETKKE